ncbi:MULTISPECIES: hypothetical protein [Cellulomonas]|uniref:hypothetical protein n=1 Tax=Cellulomonas TaxID=1707 RepID=UPI001B9A5797|nr:MULTISPECIES: hypothetical protein [Cellulomonas]VTR75277.1 hypothetical protein CHMI_00021 [Cellulomonas hominis]
MTDVYIHAAASWDEADAHVDELTSNLSLRRSELAERLAADGLALDVSVDGLVPLNEWYIEAVLGPQEHAEVDFRPGWAGPGNPGFVPTPDGPRQAPGWLLLLWEQVAVHVGDVVMAQVPGARWVCWRARNPRDIKNGKPVIDVGDPSRPVDVLACANADVVAAWVTRARPGDDGYHADATTMRDAIRAALDTRAERLAAHAPRWQAAPTGRSARRSLAQAPG